MTPVTLMADVHQLVEDARRAFRLPARRISIRPLDPRRRPLKDGHCWRVEDRRKYFEIAIRLHQAGRPRRALKPSFILGTLAHELAHIKYEDHGPEFRALALDIAAWMRDRGYVVWRVL